MTSQALPTSALVEWKARYFTGGNRLWDSGDGAAQFWSTLQTCARRHVAAASRWPADIGIDAVAIRTRQTCHIR